MEISWGNILTLAATTGIVTTLLNQGFLWIREWRSASIKKEANAGYLALRLAVVLEAYTYSCSEFISKNNEAAHLPDEEFPDWDVNLPELPPYPDDPEGWRSVDRILAGRALNLRNRIQSSKSIIRSVIEYSMEDLGDALAEHAASYGLEAWKLAVALRRKHRVEEVATVWDFAEGLEATLQKAKKAQEDRRQRSAALMAEFEAERARLRPLIVNAMADRDAAMNGG